MFEKKRLINSEELDYLNSILSNISGEIYVIELDKAIEERCDELDIELEENGYEVVDREFKRVATSIFDYKVYFTLGEDT